MTHQEFILKVIRIRKKLINHNLSAKNQMKSMKVLKRIQNTVEAYKHKWTQEQWKAFFKRNYEDIKFLIPGNKSYETYLEQLNSLTL